MFERYTEEARRTLFFSRYEASQHGQASIEAEHILLGLIRDRVGVVSRILTHAKASPDDIRAAVEKRIERMLEEMRAEVEALKRRLGG